MKTLFQKIAFLILFAAAVTGNTGALAQCTNNNSLYMTWDASIDLTAPGDVVGSVCTFAGESNTVTNMVAGNTYYISTCGDEGFDTQLTIFNSGGTAVDYNDDGCGAQSEIFFTPTTSGDYTIQINEYNCLTNSICMTMQVMLTALAPGGQIPGNDNCAGATTLSVGNGECNPVTGSVWNATASPNTSCGTGTPDDDVWYKFVATNDTLIFNILGSPGFDAVIEGFIGTGCNALTSVGCLDNSLEGELESVLFTSIPVGSTIWVRVYDYFSGAPAGTEFTICVYNPCAVTAPNGAILETETCGTDANGGCLMTVPAYQTLTCGQTVKGTTWADSSKRDTDWYRFTLTSAATVTWSGSSEIPFVLGLIDIDDCNNLVILTNGGNLTAGGACASATASALLQAGTYAAYFAPSGFDYYVCSAGYNEYWATLSYSTTTPSISAGGSTSFCQGGSVTLTSSSASGNVWSPGGATSQSISATTSGSYTVTVQDPNGCGPQTSAPVTVTVNSLPATPTITPGGNTTFCQGGSVTLTSSAGSAYLWSPGGATTQSISATSSGSYTVTVGTTGCTATSAPLTVTVNTAPATPTITPGGSTTFCQGGSVSLTSSAATTYLWSPGGSTIQSITATTGGSYTVTVGDANGCTAISAPVTVTVNSPPSTPTITPGGSTTFCQGGSVTLTSSAGSAYLWSPGGATTQAVSATATGSYTVTVGATGCTATSAPVNVTVTSAPSTPIISAGSTTTFCQGGSVTLTSTSASDYLWSPGGATTQAITAGTGGSYTVTVGPTGCTSTSAPTVVTVNQPPTAAYSYSQNDPTVNFTGSPTGGTPGYTYDWDFDDGSNHSNSQSPSHVYNSTGSFDVVFCVTDANTCTNCVTHTVTITTVGIDDNSVVNNLTIYPNPAKDVLNILFNMAETNDVEVKLMNSTGQLVFNEKLDHFSGSYNKQLNISSYAAGNYMLQVVSEAGVINRKIMVK